jgi:hypothetical protein
LGNTNAIKEALSTLAQDHILLRLGHGIYYFPKQDPVLGDLYPGLDEVAHAIARRDGVIITPTTDQAMNLLGFSQQVPVNIVYLTSGRSKEIKVGNNKIIFKQASARRSQAGKNYMGLIVRALEGIGAAQLTAEALQSIHEKMSDLPDAEIRSAVKNVPHWIANVFTDFVNQRYAKLAKPIRTKKKRNHQQH